MKLLLVDTVYGMKMIVGAVSHLFATLSLKRNLYSITRAGFFDKELLRSRGISNPTSKKFESILFRSRSLVPDRNLRANEYQVNLLGVANLIIRCFEINNKAMFLVLPGIDNVINDEATPKALKEFFVDYKSGNIKKYYFKRFYANGTLKNRRFLNV